jgi:hypothetical protein
MPEKDNWDELRNRLQNYSEEPDDSWEKISTALSPTQVKSSSANYWMASALVGVISLLIPFTLMDYRTVEQTYQLAKLDSLKIDNFKFKEQKVIRGIEKEINRQGAIKSASTNATKENHAKNFERSKGSHAEPKSSDINDVPLEKTVSPTALNEIIPSMNAQTGLSEEITSDSISQKLGNSKEAIDSTQKVVEPIIIKEKKKSSLTYYASITPTLNYYSITSKEVLNGRVNGFDSKGIFSTDRFGVAAEFGIQFPIYKKLELFSGLTYYYQNQKLNYQFIHSDVLDVEKVEESLTYIITPRQSSQGIIYQMNNIGLNLGMLYEINQRRGLSQQAGLSILYQYGLSKNESSYENRSSSYWGYQLSYRMTFDLGSKKFFVQPSLLRLIGSKENLSEPILIRATRAGIGMGLVF